MPALPTTEDVRQVRKQAEAGVTATIQVVKSPLLAALGAVDAATKAVTEAFGKARSEAADRRGETQHRLLKALNELQARVSELPAEIGELRHRLEPAELRKRAEDYREATQQAYVSLIERGEEVFGEFRSQPRVRHALDSVETGVDAAQERLEAVVREVNAAVEDLRSRFALSSRSVGEKIARGAEQGTATAAEQVQSTAAEVSGTVSEAGHDAAAAARGAARKVADRAAPPRKGATRRPGDNSTRRS